MNLSQQELQILVTILTQVKLNYNDYDLVRPLVTKLEKCITKPEPQVVKVKVKEDE